MTKEKTREVVGVFDSEEALQGAVDELMVSGFNLSNLSLLGAMDPLYAHNHQSVREIEDDPEAPLTAYADPDSRFEAESVIGGGFIYLGAMVAALAVISRGGEMANAIPGVVIAVIIGGFLGFIVSRILEWNHKSRVLDQFKRGGLPLWVKVTDMAHYQRACRILVKHNASDVHQHELPDIKFDFSGGVSRKMSFLNNHNIQAFLPSLKGKAVKSD